MIFLGDLACPDDKVENFVEWTNEQEIINNELLIINFEGNIVDDVNKRRNLKIHNNK